MRTQLRSRAQRGATPPGNASAPARAAVAWYVIEPLESWVLLSGYALSTLGLFGANATGANPQADVVVDAGGNLYGTTNGGGADGDGTIFEIAHGSRTITTLAAFDGSNGARPRSPYPYTHLPTPSKPG